MLRLIFPLFLLLSGCASLDDVVGGIANTPEWFQTRRVEIRGEGYPEFDDVPAQISASAVIQRLAQTEAVARSEMTSFLNNPRVEPANLTEEEIGQVAENLRANLFVDFEHTDVLLTDAEILALRAKLRPPPINKPN